MADAEEEIVEIDNAGFTITAAGAFKEHGYPLMQSATEIRFSVGFAARSYTGDVPDEVPGRLTDVISELSGTFITSILPDKVGGLIITFPVYASRPEVPNVTLTGFPPGIIVFTIVSLFRLITFIPGELPQKPLVTYAVL